MFCSELQSSYLLLLDEKSEITTLEVHGCIAATKKKKEQATAQLK